MHAMACPIFSIADIIKTIPVLDALSEHDLSKINQLIQTSTSKALWDVWGERFYWMSQILLFGVAAIGAGFAYRQWNDQRFISTIELTHGHNWHVATDVISRNSIIFAKLNVEDNNRDLYWSTRLLHLNHILLRTSLVSRWQKNAHQRSIYKLATFWESSGKRIEKCAFHRQPSCIQVRVQ